MLWATKADMKGRHIVSRAAFTNRTARQGSICKPDLCRCIPLNQQGDNAQWSDGLKNHVEVNTAPIFECSVVVTPSRCYYVDYV